MDKRFWVIVVGLAVVLSGVFYFTSRKAEAPASSTTKATATNHVSGSTSTGVKLVEYGDFQCPACGRYYQPVKEVTEKYKDKIQFQFRNFPLVQIHTNAMAAHRAAEAADLQGKFWEMHDMLYEGQPSWTQATSVSKIFEGYATTIGLDLAKYKEDVKSRQVNDRIQADLKEGNKIPVESTPTFVLDGKKISNPDPTVEAWSKVIDAAIAKKSAAAKQ